MSETDAGARRRPNLLLLMTDQQRADTVEPGGPCLTPHLQALAADGVRFDRCYATNPICSPSRASLYTGLLPHAHGMTDVTHAVDVTQADLRPDLPFWSRTLREAGYRTGHFGKWHVERSDDLARFGFDEHEVDLRLTGVASYDGPLSPRVAVRQEGYREFLLAGVHDGPAAETREGELFDRGIAFVREAAREPDRPWALVVSTEAPHDPYVVPRELYRRYDPETLRPPTSAADDLADRPAIYRRIRRTWDGLSADDAAQATACYYAACSGIDDHVGRILAALRDTGQEERTLVVFTSDHGDYLGAHGLWLKGVPAFEEAYRVPMLLRGPGVPRGLRIDDPVSLLDLPRTLVRLLLGRDFGGQGGDLTGRFGAADPGEGGADGVAEDAPTANEPALRPGEAYAEFHGQRLRYTQRIVWRGRHKYVFNGFADDELYDLEADPHELRNLAAEPATQSVARALANRMWQVARATGDRTLAEAEYGMFRFAPVGPAGCDDDDAVVPDGAAKATP
ncbi:MAG: sulfatase-like hydrolase/transferase [Trueperaceae bacterium]